jgi:TolB-like protein/DNA-binding winged helix-turn-helix (wHTH) protein
MPPPLSKLRFDTFEFDPGTGELWSAGGPIPLQRRPARLLHLLLERPGDVISREEIRAALWGEDVHVDFDRSLNFCVAKLRAALGDDAARPRYVETLPTRGYRFVGALASPPEALAASRPARPRRRMWLAFAVAAGVAAVAVLAVPRVYRALAGPPKVVVVPFHNETGSPELDRVAKGVSDATVVKLAASRGLEVIGNASGLVFSFRPPDMRAMGQSLGAQYLVLGQMKRDDRRMRIVAHLIRVSDQTHVWARTYDTDTLDLPHQSSIADEIAAAVADRIGG